MKENDEGVPTDVFVHVCVHIQYVQIHSAKELLPFQVILLLIPSSLELLTPCHQTFHVPKMEESSPCFSCMDKAYVREFPTPKIAL